MSRGEDDEGLDDVTAALVRGGDRCRLRDRLSAYAYPRLVEFVPDLPKTLTGKIRRIELRERERREPRPGA